MTDPSPNPFEQGYAASGREKDDLIFTIRMLRQQVEALRARPASLGLVQIDSAPDFAAQIARECVSTIGCRAQTNTEALTTLIEDRDAMIAEMLRGEWSQAITDMIADHRMRIAHSGIMAGDAGVIEGLEWARSLLDHDQP